MKILIILIAVLSFNHSVLADSPLTSTEISRAYLNVPIVIKASKTKGELTVALMKYLMDKKNPIAYKIAVINELSLNAIGNFTDDDNTNLLESSDDNPKKLNGVIFHNYISKVNHYQTSSTPLRKADSEVLICLAYLKAFDSDYLSEAIMFAKRARIKNPTSYTIHIICALIEAQQAVEKDLCLTYQLTNYVRINKDLNKDMNQKGIKIVFEYMDLYKKDCTITNVQDIHADSKKAVNTIIKQISTLSSKHPKQLVHIKDADIEKDISHQTFSISFFYQKGKKKRHLHRNLRDDDFEENGIGLNIFFYKGEWPGSKDVNIIPFGDLNIVIYILNDKNGLYQDIEKIIIAEREKLKIVKNEQDNGIRNHQKTISRDKAIQIAKKDANGFLGTWIDCSLKNGNWHINAHSKSANPPKYYVINSENGEILLRLNNTDHPNQKEKLSIYLKNTQESVMEDYKRAIELAEALMIKKEFVLGEYNLVKLQNQFLYGKNEGRTASSVWKIIYKKYSG